ncbi:MAG: nucleotidyltransferase domain-containing protein [Thermoanaerobaculia bacterium]
MTFPALVLARRPALDGLCRDYGVRRLSLFGSAAGDGFDPARGDLDFLVDFEPKAGLNRFRQFMRFKLALEALFDRPVDLIVIAAVRDEGFRAAAEARAIDVYAA